MEESKTKAELIDAVRSARADLDRLLADVGEQRLTEPNAFDSWSVKDVIAHLNGWRWYSVARMEAARDGTVAVSPWPSYPEPDDATDEVNQAIYEANRDRPPADVLAESAETFDRLEAALAAIPEEALFEPGRFAWLPGYPLAAVVEGMREHFYEEHEPPLRAWLAGQKEG